MKRFITGILILSTILVAGLSVGRQDTDVVKNKKSSDAGERKVRDPAPESLTHTSRQQISEGKVSNLGRSPLFTQYWDLSSKALRSDDENRSLEMFFSNSELIDRSFEILAARNERDFDLDVQDRRMEQVEFLSRALSDRGNPARARILRALPEIIDRDVAALDVSPVLKRSLAGDQIELFQILKNCDATMASALEERSKGTSNERIIAYAAKNQERI